MSHLDNVKELIAKGNKEGAIKSLVSALQNNSNDVDTWLLLGELIDDSAKKRDCYNKVLKLSPNNPLALNGLSRLETSGIISIENPIAKPDDTQPINAKKENIHCPSCGNKTPENSAFCLHCGAKISSPNVALAQSAVLEWEEVDFTYSWSHKETYYDARKLTESQVRAELWTNFQAQIASQMQKMYVDGWQTIEEVSPSKIRLNYFSELNTGAWLIVGIITGGILLLFPSVFSTKYIEPTMFRISMRRPVKSGTVKKTNGVVQEKTFHVTSSRYRGTVSWYNSQKGFGYIKRDDNGKDVYINQKGLRKGFTHLNDGESVEFSIGNENTAEDVVSLSH